MMSTAYQLLPKIARIVLLGLAATACDPIRADITPPSVNTNSPGPVPTKATVPAKDIVEVTDQDVAKPRIWTDCSTSMDHEAIDANIDKIIATLRTHAEEMTGVEVICFANGSELIWNARVDVFTWGSPPPSPPPFVANFDNAQPKDRLYKHAHDDIVREQQAEYNRRNEAILAEYATKVESMLDKLKTRLLTKPAEPAVCTMFSELIDRMQRENRRWNLVISDLLQDCEDSEFENFRSVRMTGNIVFLQTPSKGARSGLFQEIRSREQAIKRLIPTAEVYPIFMADTGLKTLLRQ